MLLKEFQMAWLLRMPTSLARKWGLYNGAPAEDFSFSDTFNPVKPKTARFGDARVRALYSALTSDEDFQAKYLDYAMGRNITN
jgi:hypothetical protein